MNGEPLTDDEKTAIRRLHGEGKSLRQIAETIGRSTGAVSEHSKAMGLTYDREKTEAATHAAMVDNRARRAAIIEWQLNRCLKLAERLDADTFSTVGNSQEGPVTVDLTFVPAQDELHLSRAMGQYAKTAADLEKIDMGFGADHALSEIGKIGAALSVVAQVLDVEPGA